MKDSDYEQTMFARMRSLDDTEKFSYSERGRICLEISRSLVYRERIDPETGEPCSLTRWIRLAAPWGYSTCFAAMRDMEALKDIPSEQLAKVPESNFSVLKQLSTQVRNTPSVLEAARTKRSDEFIEHIKRDYPSQHIESRKVLRFPASESQAADIEEAIALAMENGAMNRTEALWAIALDYRATCALEEMSKEME
jgi:hypothetical protein